MDKYGVSTGGHDKTASKGCPKCGAALDKKANVKKCPNCGTAPFESLPPDTRKEKRDG